MSDWPISIRYDGKPQGKGRPRFGKGNVYTPSSTKVYEQGLAWAAKVAMGQRDILTGPVKLEVVAVFEGITEGPCVLKPDLDNIIKIIKDSLNGVVYLDDCQVSEILATKIIGPTSTISIVIGPHVSA